MSLRSEETTQPAFRELYLHIQGDQQDDESTLAHLIPLLRSLSLRPNADIRLSVGGSVSCEEIDWETLVASFMGDGFPCKCSVVFAEVTDITDAARARMIRARDTLASLEVSLVFGTGI